MSYIRSDRGSGHGSHGSHSSHGTHGSHGSHGSQGRNNTNASNNSTHSGHRNGRRGGNVPSSCPTSFSYLVPPSSHGSSSPRNTRTPPLSTSLPALPPTPQGNPVLHTADRHSNSLRCPADYDRGYYDGIKYGKRNAQHLLNKDKDSFFAAGRQHGRNQGYQDGHRAGHRDGYQDSFLRGHERGHREGRQEGHQEGRQEGHREGRQEGHREGRQEGRQEGHREGHQQGLREGHQQGHREGHREGHHEGHRQGHREGHREGFRRGYQEGYDKAVSRSSTPTSALRGHVQEFVPGQEISTPVKQTVTTGPLVVDGSSGPGVSPTAYKARLFEEEWQQKLRARGMHAPFGPDFIPLPDMMPVNPGHMVPHGQPGGQVPFYEGPMERHVDLAVDDQQFVSSPEQTVIHVVDESASYVPEQIPDETFGQAVEQFERDGTPDACQQDHDVERGTVEASQLDGQSVVEPEQAVETAETATEDEEHHMSKEVPTALKPEVVHKEQPAGSDAAVNKDHQGNNESNVQQNISANLSRSTTPVSCGSDAPAVVYNAAPDRKSQLHYIGQIPVAIPRLSNLLALRPLPTQAKPRVDKKAIKARVGKKKAVNASVTEQKPVAEITAEETPVITPETSDSSNPTSDVSEDDSGAQGDTENEMALIQGPETANIEEPGTEETHEHETVDATPAMTQVQFDDLVIFHNYEPDPPLGPYQSTLFQAQPVFEIGPDQAPQITESYPLYRTRDRNSFASAHNLHEGQLEDPISTIRERNGVVFPVGGRTPPRGICKIVPDHVVYKFGVPPANYAAGADSTRPRARWGQPGIGSERLARCVQHGLSTCPMCAITPSFKFLGPGEAVARIHDHTGRQIGDPQTNPTSFWRFRPLGFGDFQMHGMFFRESSLAEVQHPDEASPQRAGRFVPQFDAEVLGHCVEGGDGKTEKPLSPCALDTLCCEQCGGLTWLVTRRSRPHSHSGDRTFGKAHPSHHASYNEAWSRAPSFCATSTRHRFPEQSGTTRSLFVQLSAVADRTTKGTNALGKKVSLMRFGVGAFFGPGSRYNTRMDVDLATATMDVVDATLTSTRQRLVDMPYETFTCNAGPILAVAVALHRLWTEVVPAHRAAIDQVTRYNSDHSRRKAYRFRAILMCDSAYIVDLFSDQLKDRWHRRFRLYQRPKGKQRKARTGVPPSDSEVVETPVGPTAAEPKKKNKPKKKAKKRRGPETDSNRDILVEITTSTTTTATTADGLQDDEEAATVRASQDDGGHANDMDEDDGMGLDSTADRADGSFSISTPSSGCRSPRAPSPVQAPPELAGLVYRAVQNGARDNLDFDRPDGRFLYCGPRGAALPNSVLVHLAWRYMELLRGHGVHVAFYHVEREYVQGARQLAKEVVQGSQE